MFDPPLRRLKDRVLDPIAGALAFASPNALTGVSAVVGLGCAAAVWQGRFGAAFGLWVLNRMLDGLDGAVARMYGKATDFGGYLDLLSDFLVYAAVPTAMALRPGADPELGGAVVVLLAVFYVNTASWMVPAAILEKRNQGVRARSEPTSVTIPEGLISGGETVVFYGLFLILPDLQVELVYAMSALTVVTVAHRLFWAARVFR